MNLPITTITTLAWRNLWRNKRRTLIMLSAISIGVWAMIFLTALMRGMVEDMLTRGLDKLPGHIQIHQQQFLDDPSIVNSMAEPEGELLLQLNQASGAQQWFSRIKVPSVIASERETRGVTLLGIDPQAERDIILTGNTIIEGRFLESADDKGLVIGAKLADRLETRLGKRVVLMSQDPKNNVAERGFRIVGIYKADLASQEEITIYAGKRTIQTLLKIPGKVSEVAIFGDDYRNAEPLQQHLAGLLAKPSTTELSIQTWQDIDGYLGGMVNVMDGFVLVWVIVIFLAMSFGLANTLVMALYERIREIGLMLALGMAPMMILWQILVESFFLLAIGLLIGNSLAYLAVNATAGGIDLSVVSEGLEMAGMGTTLYPALFTKDVLTANIVVIVLGILTSVLPALRAAHFDPIRAINKST